MPKNSKRLLAQFLIGLAVATVASTIIGPLGSQTVNPVVAITGIISAMIFLAIALAQDHLK